MGFDKRRPKQEEIISAFLRRNDVFGVLPTGYGKTLCFLCLPAAFDLLLSKESRHSLVVVISTLKALMEDQVGYTD